MSKKGSKLNGATAFTIIASILFLLIAPLTSQAAGCQPDQMQLQTQGAIGLGGRTVVSQTFIPSAPGQRVCRVKVFISAASGYPVGATIPANTPTGRYFLCARIEPGNKVAERMSVTTPRATQSLSELNTTWPQRGES